jgi:hypothetical protein
MRRIACLVALMKGVARDLVNVSTPLTDGDAMRVLSAARASIAGRHGRLISTADEAAGRAGTEFAISGCLRQMFPEGLVLTFCRS